jgi:hypothetical protein
VWGCTDPTFATKIAIQVTPLSRRTIADDVPTVSAT